MVIICNAQPPFEDFEEFESIRIVCFPAYCFAFFQIASFDLISWFHNKIEFLFRCTTDEFEFYDDFCFTNQTTPT